MQFRRLLGCVCSLVVGLLLTFSLLSTDTLKAHAALSGGRYMTASEARTVFGDTIPFQYWNGSDYVSGTFTYDSSSQVLGCDGVTKTDYINSNPVALKYVATVSNVVNTNNNYVTVDIRPSYSIFDTSQLHSLIALSRGSNPVSSTFTSPSWDWVWGGSAVHLENNVLNSSNVKAQIYFQDWNYCTYVPADFNSQSLTSGYSVRAAFSGNSPSSNKYYLYIGVPYVDSDATGSNGTFTTDSGGGSGGDVNVNVEVDMEETNGLLSDIWDLISGIPDAIANIFIPDDEALEEFSDDLSDLLEDHLGGIYEAADLIAGIWDQFENVSASSSIYIPPCNVPLAGSTLTLGDWTVPLKVDGMPQILYTSLAWIIDFIATASFLNMCRKKLEIFLNPDSEVVSSDN